MPALVPYADVQSKPKRPEKPFPHAGTAHELGLLEHELKALQRDWYWAVLALASDDKDASLALMTDESDCAPAPTTHRVIAAAMALPTADTVNLLRIVLRTTQ